LNYITASDSYYLKSFPTQAGGHTETCHFFTENTISTGSSYIKNCEEDEDGNFHVNLAAHDYKKLNKKAAPTSNGTVLDNDRLGESASKLTTSQFIKLIVAKAWNDYIFFQGRTEYPNLKTIFNQIIKSTTKKFFISKNTRIQDILFSGGKTGRIYYIEQSFNNKFNPFVLFPLKEIIQTGEQVLLILENPLNESSLKFTVEKVLWGEVNNSVNVSTGPFFVGGFVNSTGRGLPPQFVSIGILSINHYGVPIESSFEREAYDLFCSQRRLVQRPIDTKYHPKWNGLIPDGLFIDTELPTIVEVFGMSESDIEYHLHRQFKIDHFSRLKSNYGLWYWDAFNNSPKPSLPTLKNE
jgi:hypothetical protein